MNSRDLILEKLKQAQVNFTVSTNLDTNKTEEVGRPDFSVMERSDTNVDKRLAQFTQQITSTNGEVHCCQPDTWLEVLKKIISQKNIRSILWPSTSDMESLSASLESEVLFYDKPIEEWKEKLFDDVDASLTTCLGAIAETGSLVLWPTKDEPRLMSLVPPIHFVLLYKSKIELTFWHFMKKHNWAQGMPTNALLISGPSKTADIEQTLAYGVHGPQELVVLIVEDC